MAQLDKLLSVMIQKSAEALYLDEDQPSMLKLEGNDTPVTKPLNGPQVVGLLKRIGADSLLPGGGGADIGPIMQRGVPGMSHVTDGDYFWYHHTDADTVVRALALLDRLSQGGQDNLFYYERIAAEAVFAGQHRATFLYQPLTIETAGGAREWTLNWAYQVDPLSRRLLHADFYRIAMDKLLVVKVPVTVKGEAKGIKQQGGLLDIVHREVEVECLPSDIPEHIEIDINAMHIGDIITLGSLAQANLHIYGDPDTAVVSVTHSRGAQETPASRLRPARDRGCARIRPPVRAARAPAPERPAPGRLGKTRGQGAAPGGEAGG